MKESIKTIINRIYNEKDYNYFKEACTKKLPFIDELLKNMHPICEKINDYSLKEEPSYKFYIVVNNTNVNNINIKYTSILKISKITNFFYLQNEISIENPDPNRMDTYIDTYRDEPYSKQQFRLEEIINNILVNNNYYRLMFCDADEVCLDSPNITVETAVFDDYLDINHGE